MVDSGHSALGAKLLENRSLKMSPKCISHLHQRDVRLPVRLCIRRNAEISHHPPNHSIPLHKALGYCIIHK